jgi:hypothetical protein
MTVFAVCLLLQGCCSDVVNVVSTPQIDIDCKDLGRKAPLLLTELVVAPEGASFTYSTPIDSMHSKIITVFDRAITKLQVGLLGGLLKCSRWNTSSCWVHMWLPVRQSAYNAC